MNLALHGIEADFGPEYADTFRRDLHPDLRADYVLAIENLKTTNETGQSSHWSCAKPSHLLPLVFKHLNERFAAELQLNRESGKP